MRFQLPDTDTSWQEIQILDTPDGNVKIDIYSAEDVGEIIKQNKKAQRAERKTLGKGTQTSMYQLGSLSTVMTHELMKKRIFQDDKKLREWFNDLDNYLWRTVDKKRRGNAI